MTRRPRLALALPAVLVLLSISVGGCAPPAPADSATVTPERVVVIAPAAAEMLGELELLDRVVAIGEYGPWPAAIAALPVAGGYSSPNAETVLALGAQMVINTSSEASGDAHRKLEALGVEVLALDTSTLDGVYASIESLGRAFGVETKARELAERIRGELAEIETVAGGAPARRVLFVVGRDPLYVAGPGSHIDGMIQAVGAVNAAAGARGAYVQLSVEAAIEQRPDVIIDTSDNRPEAVLGTISGEWERWDFLPAVRDHQVYRVHPSQLVIPGIRLPAMTRRMGRLIQPERFGPPTPEDFQPVPAESGDVDDGSS